VRIPPTREGVGPAFEINYRLTDDATAMLTVSPGAQQDLADLVLNAADWQSTRLCFERQWAGQLTPLTFVGEVDVAGALEADSAGPVLSSACR